MSATCSGAMPTMGRLGPASVLATVPTSISVRVVAARTVSSTLLADLVRPIAARSSSGVRTGLSVDRDDDVARLELPRRRCVGRDVRRRGRPRAPPPCRSRARAARPRRRSPASGPSAAGSGGAARRSSSPAARAPARGPSRRRPAGSAARAPPAATPCGRPRRRSRSRRGGVRLLAFDVAPARQAASPVREQQVAVGRQDAGRADGDARRPPRRRPAVRASQNMPRISPPSTPIVAPVT